jgi:hypothetical protein
MKIYSFSKQLEAAVAELLGDTRLLFSDLLNYQGPAYVKALRYLKARRPGVFQGHLRYSRRFQLIETTQNRFFTSV